MTEPFHGAKIAILVGDQIVTILRDDIPDIPWPNHWDLPGGARDGTESPMECALRELHEELGLTLDQARITRINRHVSPPNFVWFFIAEWPDFDPKQVVFGDEGQEWRLASLDWYLAHEKTIPQHKSRLIPYLKQRETPRF